MTRWILLIITAALAVTAVIVSERQKVDVPASPAALLYLVADTEKELTRMPVHFTRMSDADEIRIGDEIATSYGTPDADESNKTEVQTVERYLNQVGAQLSARAHRRLPYRFHYVPSQFMINAFALPGGHVYVGAGLLALMDSEDELAAVLGHEIEHVDHYHCVDRAQQEQALRRIPLGGLVALPIFLFEAGYSKGQELEADREGTRLAVEAGYSATGAIRMFETMDRMYQRYMGRGPTKPASPQEELSQVALQTLEGYFHSHPLSAERIAQIQKMIASEGWTARPERDLAVAYIFWTVRSQASMNAKKYAEAEQLASRSLKMNPQQPNAWDVLARAQFSQANFSGAADSYRQLLEADPKKLSYVAAYASALAAANRQSAAAEFSRWLNSVPGDKPRNAQAELAGLRLLAGDTQAARKYEVELQTEADGWAPDYLGELGWFYYLSGDSTRASQLLEQSAQQRPGDLTIWLRRTWTQIEIRRYSDAIQSINNGVFEPALQGERAMAQAVAFWQAKETDEALSDYDRAIAAQPEWGNQQWVKALYSPLVVQTVEQMQAERERQKKVRMGEKH